LAATRLSEFADRADKLVALDLSFGSVSGRSFWRDFAAALRGDETHRTRMQAATTDKFG
jgi:hypothetical protein